MFEDRRIFANRTEAGGLLARELVRFATERPVVLALPRGGVPIGLAIARVLNAPLDVVLVRKIGTPSQPELALGAVVDGSSPETVLNRDVLEHFQIEDTYIAEASRQQLEEIERRRRLYLAGRAKAEVAGRTAIVVDDGIATGATMEAALRATRRREPKRLVLATPVAPPDTIERLRPEVDEVVCLATPQHFGAIGAFYRDFRQLSDDDVIRLLADAAAFGGPEAPGSS